LKSKGLEAAPPAKKIRIQATFITLLKGSNMSTYITTLGSGTAVVPARDLAETLRDMQSSLDELVKRMNAAMVAIAEEAGAFECDYCGRYTLESIEVEDVDEHGASWGSREFCPACVPSCR
jgi:hypothetical protein